MILFGLSSSTLLSECYLCPFLVDTSAGMQLQPEFERTEVQEVLDSFILICLLRIEFLWDTWASTAAGDFNVNATHAVYIKVKTAPR